MIVAFQTLFCFIITVIGISLGECLIHKYFFHKSIPVIKGIPKLWKYNPSKHTTHHKVCFQEMEDQIDSEEDYWVQRPSNTFLAGCILYSLESALLYVLGFDWTFFILTAIFNASLLTFWFKFEDKFHLAMHKNDYYMKHIQGTWYDSWFQYCKRLHAIHHKNFSYNLGFVFFPIGDIILGTYCKNYDEISKERVKVKK